MFKILAIIILILSYEIWIPILYIILIDGVSCT